MRRVAISVAGIAIMWMTLTLTALPSHAAGGAKCVKYDSYGVCIVWVGGKGGGGNHGGNGGQTGSGSSGGPQRCTEDPPGKVVPCRRGDAWWDQGRQCYVSLASPQPPHGNAAWEGHTTGAIYNCSFYEAPGQQFPGTNGYSFWSAAAPARAADPAVLAQQAFAKLTVPGPTPGRYPAGTMRDGRPYTVVRAHTWYWTSPASYRPLSSTAAAGGLSVTVTVTPSALTFTPGDGSAAVSCTGPGIAWTSTYGPWAPSPAGCDYKYPHSSIHEPNGEVTATYGIDWKITWTASNGQAGTLPGMTTTARSTFAVAEVESVVIR